MNENLETQDNRFEKFQVWGWRITMIFILSLFFFSIYIGDGFWIMNCIIALLVMWFCGKPRKEHRQSTGISLAILLDSKLKHSENPVSDFQETIHVMIQKRNPPETQIIGILEYFSKQESAVGLEARAILESTDFKMN